jgi:RHS repeat-associated protein
VRSGGPITQTDKLYTGQQIEPGGDPAFGLYNYKARFYSTFTGQFVSADTSARDGFNRYSYVSDNPLRLTDPSGHWQKVPNTGGRHDPNCDDACALRALSEASDTLELLGVVDLDSFWREVSTLGDPSRFLRDVLGDVESVGWADDALAIVVSAVASLGIALVEEGVSIVGDEIVITGERVLAQFAQESAEKEGDTWFGRLRRAGVRNAGPAIARASGKVTVTVAETEMDGGTAGAAEFFEQQAGRAPAGPGDSETVNGVRYVYRVSSKGEPTVEMVRPAQAVIEKIRFIP